MRTRAGKQKQKMLESIFEQNLLLVGKEPAQRKAPFNMGLSVWLGVLVFIGFFIITDTVGSRIRQGFGLFGTIRSEDYHENPSAAAGGDGGAKPSVPAAYQAQQDLAGPLVAEATAQSAEDKKQAQEYVNLIIQSLETKSVMQDEMQDYAKLADDSPVHIKKMFGLGVRTIIIHGGEDPGAVGALGTREKEITFDIARMLKARLEAAGTCRVVLTRTADKFISLKQRTVIANESGGDLFVSVHVNFLPGRSSLNIIETLYFGPSKDATEIKLAEKENEGSGFTINDYNQMIKKLSATMKLQESRQLAQCIQQHLFQSIHAVNLDTKDYGVKRAPFVVLLGAEMPGVLVEVSCLSNRDEEQRLRDPAYREAIATYIETGITNYLEARSTGHDSKRAERDERHLFRRN
jgi:N-acetylmuramoyl-L-alanine amidase